MSVDSDHAICGPLTVWYPTSFLVARAWARVALEQRGARTQVLDRNIFVRLRTGRCPAACPGARWAPSALAVSRHTGAAAIRLAGQVHYGALPGYRWPMRRWVGRLRLARASRLDGGAYARPVPRASHGCTGYEAAVQCVINTRFRSEAAETTTFQRIVSMELSTPKHLCTCVFMRQSQQAMQLCE
jgi:hypothetical protein